MKFAYTIVYTADVNASLEFFERAFGLPRRFLHESGTYGEVETDSGTALAFASHEAAQNNLGQAYRRASDGAPLGMEIGLTTEDVAGAYVKAVAAGAQGLVEPVTKPWGQVVSYVRCPDGTLVELCSPMG